MATVSLSALSTTPHSSRVTNSHRTHKLSTFVPIRDLCLHSCNKVSFSLLTFRKQRNDQKVRSSEEETAVVDEQPTTPPQEAPEAEQPTVSVPVSPSDKLTMYFQAEGTMSEIAIPKVTRALEGMEGVTDLNVQILEGIAKVELAKQTTVQATGVASGLVEAIQGSGFKLQTLNLSFQEEEYVFA
ncbi:uncharacterized protein LOC120009886 [Tripterygium wilfordii]|uniref:uncharacterized protein LOC120009886 n=1 Tax=Tripterygium wilfordii TaxID=458696 RepID=UPI0018F824BC|nr:uncharacterized protein LOC120009886 [Tripterygium wilfordii]